MRTTEKTAAERVGMLMRLPSDGTSVEEKLPVPTGFSDRCSPEAGPTLSEPYAT
jgi:hypothetical protein